jgi:hypothetical protein
MLPSASTVREPRFSNGTHKCDSILFFNSDLFNAPTTCSDILPFLKNMSVGMDIIPYWLAVRGFSSTSTFPTFILPSYSRASSSSRGAIALHGPHQVAQKSTNTGVSESRTSVLKLPSVKCRSAIGVICKLRVYKLGQAGNKNITKPVFLQEISGHGYGLQNTGERLLK